MYLVPAIDMIDGKCVRLSQGDYDRKTVYYDDPLEFAKILESRGIKRLHLVDLDGARSGSPKNLDTVRRICSATDLVVDFGGGAKSRESLESVLDAGAKFVSIGSLAVSDRKLAGQLIMEYGERIILSADCRNERISINGWKEDTDEDVADFIGYYLDIGIRKVVCTDISTDGMLSGPNVKLYERLIERYPEMELIASGGVSCRDDLERLYDAGCDSVIIGKALYEGRIDLEELRELGERYA